MYDLISLELLQKSRVYSHYAPQEAFPDWSFLKEKNLGVSRFSVQKCKGAWLQNKT